MSISSAALAAAGESATKSSVDSIENTDNLDFLEKERSVPIDMTKPTPFSAVKKTDKNEFVIAPIPFLNPSQGWGLALVGQYIFTMNDDDSPPSIVAGGAFITEKHSTGAALGYLGKIHNDRWRLGAIIGTADIYYDFYGVGTSAADKNISIPIKQTGKFAGVQILNQIYDKLFVGLELLGVDLTTEVNPDHPEYNIGNEVLSIKNDFVSPDIKLEWDKRDDTFYPTHGFLSDLTMTFHSQAFHDNTDYQTYKISWNQYHEIATFDVLAWRAMARFAYGDVPFYDLSLYGQQGDLRGYETGKYRDKMMWAAQAEWRHRFTDRWGGVAFAGLGEVAPTVADFGSATILPSGGLGLRFRIASKNALDFRFDTAYGDHAISYYFSVGQAF